MGADRERYDALVRITDEVEKLCGNGSGLLDVAYYAMRLARDYERPTVDVDDRTARAEAIYPPCKGCPEAGGWGATGIMPPGHVLVRWRNGVYLAHLREH